MSMSYLQTIMNMCLGISGKIQLLRNAYTTFIRYLVSHNLTFALGNTNILEAATAAASIMDLLMLSFVLFRHCSLLLCEHT